MNKEQIAALYRVFNGQDLSTTYIIMDGGSARNDFLRDLWNRAVELGWLRVESVELEQESFMKGYLTDIGVKEVFGG